MAKLQEIVQAPRTNRLLAALPTAEMEAIRPHLEPVDLPIGLPLYDRDKEPAYVYLPHRGVASLVADMEDLRVVEIATIGAEGIVGLPLLLGGTTIAHRAFMQIPGEGARIKAKVFLKLRAQCPQFSGLLLRYVLALIHQIAQNAACNRVHTVEERAARWLLMTHDRMNEGSFYLTQEFLGQMLGVRRPTVSLAAGLLAKAGYITYSRGLVTVQDRQGLERAACECYRVITSETERLTGSAA